jgi:hypothetical protein
MTRRARFRERKRKDRRKETPHLFFQTRKRKNKKKEEEKGGRRRIEGSKSQGGGRRREGREAIPHLLLSDQEGTDHCGWLNSFVNSEGSKLMSTGNKRLCAWKRERGLEGEEEGEEKGRKGGRRREKEGEGGRRREKEGERRGNEHHLRCSTVFVWQPRKVLFWNRRAPKVV